MERQGRHIASVEKGEIVHIQTNASGDGTKKAEDLFVEFVEVTGCQGDGRNINVVVEEVSNGQKTGRRFSVGGGIKIK